ncbi:hypothetical protein [Tolypothrix sp. VBCCA 56010]|uniref:hypothetical protein n=1 Tax=Tolypothrix sp. VBCCA 56010 TaxID=3137731 RepID=UPI003D7D6AA9
MSTGNHQTNDALKAGEHVWMLDDGRTMQIGQMPPIEPVLVTSPHGGIRRTDGSAWYCPLDGLFRTLAGALAAARDRCGVDVEPYVLKAAQEGIDLNSEQEAAAEYLKRSTELGGG